jgi:uncharacterized membrane protein YhaH (DUF805 family)
VLTAGIHGLAINIWLSGSKGIEPNMLGFLFGFNARIGRLNFFLATIVLAIVMTGIAFGIASYAYNSNAFSIGEPLSLEAIAWPLLVAGAFFAFVTFTLQAMRIRDIGWDPVCVIPAWIAAVIIDGIVASKLPILSLGQGHHGTIVGALTNLAMLGILTFWPSGDFIDLTPTADLRREMKNSPRSPSPAADRIARVSSGEFGRRG